MTPTLIISGIIWFIGLCLIAGSNLEATNSQRTILTVGTIIFFLTTLIIGITLGFNYPNTDYAPTTLNIVKELNKTSKDSVTIILENQLGKTFEFITYQQGIEIGDTLVLTPSYNVIEY